MRSIKGSGLPKNDAHKRMCRLKMAIQHESVDMYDSTVPYSPLNTRDRCQTQKFMEELIS